MHDQFDLILTHDKEILINFEEKARYVPADTISVGEQYFGMNMEFKNKLISFNFSKKLICSIKIGHKLRHTIAKRYEVYDDQVIYKLGSGPQGIRIVEKGEMLRPYYFSICIENSLYSDYFTEKIMDCFITGVVPIYWGSSNIKNYFNQKGILRFESLEELDVIIDKI